MVEQAIVRPATWRERDAMHTADLIISREPCGVMSKTQHNQTPESVFSASQSGLDHVLESRFDSGVESRLVTSGIEGGYVKSVAGDRGWVTCG